MNRCRFKTLPVLILIALASWAELPTRVAFADAPSAVPPGAESEAIQDIVFLAGPRPLLIRLHIFVKGEGFLALRRKWANEQFAVIDADKNGVIEGSELAQIPAGDALKSEAGDGALAAASPDSDPADGKVSLEEFRKYILNYAGGVFTIHQPLTNNADQADLFPILDQNRDGKLTPDEFDAVAKSLQRYDRNEDDIVDAQELLLNLRDQQLLPRQQPTSAVGLLAIIDRAEGLSLIARRMIESYDKIARDPMAKKLRRDELLTNAELGVTPPEFAAADRDGNGTLDRIELERLAEVLDPVLELAIQVPSAAGTSSLKILRSPGPDVKPLLDLEQTAAGQYRLKIDDIEFELRLEAEPDGKGGELRSQYASQFKGIDSDKNDYIDLNEMRRFDQQSRFFNRADVDRDGKVFEREWLAEVDRQLGLSLSSVTLSIAGERRSLFDLFDANSDQRLTIRELRNAPQKFSTWDSDGDGFISASELAIRLSAVLTPGMARVDGPFSNNRFAQVRTRTRMRANTNATGDDGRPAPSWFSKMDRNRDGDLSPREFLGRRAEFDALDKNKDGLLSPEEANSAGASAKPSP